MAYLNRNKLIKVLNDENSTDKKDSLRKTIDI